MKTKDTEFLQSFQEYALKTGEGKDRTMLAFKKRIYVDDLNTYLRGKTKKVVEVGIGSLDCRVMIILRHKGQDQIAFYRDWLLAKGIRISDLYVTFKDKADGEFVEESLKILHKEADLFKKDCIIINHTEQYFDGYVKNVNDNNFRRILELNAKDSLSEEEKGELVSLKKEYWINVREILNYRVF